MKKVLIFIGVIAAACLVAMAQTNSVGPQIAAFINNGGVWNPATTTSTNFPIDNAPAMEMYCFNTTTHKWVPADSNCFGGGTSFNPASPGPIGGTTPGSGAFTTLSATGQVLIPQISNVPALVAANDLTTGLEIGNIPGTFVEVLTGVPSYYQSATQDLLPAAVRLRWVSGTNPLTNGDDVGFSRVSAGNISCDAVAGDALCTMKLGGLLGPAAAPSGSCTGLNGKWEFSQDGHATFCNAGTWATKI